MLEIQMMADYLFKGKEQNHKEYSQQIILTKNIHFILHMELCQFYKLDLIQNKILQLDYFGAMLQIHSWIQFKSMIIIRSNNSPIGLVREDTYNSSYMQELFQM